MSAPPLHALPCQQWFEASDEAIVVALFVQPVPAPFLFYVGRNRLTALSFQSFLLLASLELAPAQE